MRTRTRFPHTGRTPRQVFQDDLDVSRPFSALFGLATLLLLYQCLRLEPRLMEQIVIDWNELRERLCGDDDLVGSIVDLFVDECPAWLAAVVDAVEAADADRIRTSAHALKGAAGNLSAHAVTAAAAKLEHLGREGNVAECNVACAELAAECDRLLGTLRAERVH